MDRFDRIYAFHNILSHSRYPVSRRKIQEEIECSRATFTRIVEDMRDFLGAPIEYDRKLNGYFYAEEGEHTYELPGLWFNPSEIHALLACQELLEHVQPGLLDFHIKPLKERIRKILDAEGMPHENLSTRIRILNMAARSPVPEMFTKIADATLNRKRIGITYHGRSRSEKTSREISPQRFTHYRDNWYLDAWCHMQNALRTFSIDRIESISLPDKNAKEISAKKLDSYFGESYGIFAGKADKWAVLRFSALVSPWVSKEEWHPEQKGKMINGCYELTFPYNDHRELILDIMHYGPDVNAISPKALRNAVKKRLERSLRQYDL